MRGIQIQRPMTLADKQAMYGDVVYTTDARHHAYDCVQPLQGLITFTDPADETYARNNLSLGRKQRPQRENPEWLSWENVIYLMLIVKVALGGIMFGNIEIQTAYNDIYLTNFHTHIDTSTNSYDTYSIESAGITNPLRCLIIALCLVIFSVIIGLTSSKKYMLNYVTSWIVFGLLLVLQGFAFILHILMLNFNCYTTISMIILHCVTLIVSVFVLLRLAMAPQSKQANIHEPGKELMKRMKINDKGFLEPKDPKENGEYTTGDERVYNEYKQLTLTHEDIYRETTSNFWLCVVEDLNTIVCFAFVVRACDAQSSIHDDSTTFFDVLCIVFLGFLQHVANILMIFHAHIEKQAEIRMRDEKLTMSDKQSFKEQLREIFTFIARSRLLLFFMIGITIVFFYLRIAPTYEEYPQAMPYEIFRVLAVITMVSLTTLHSAWFEIQSAQNPKKSWDTSPTWKLGALAFIALIFTIMLYYNTTLHPDENIRKHLHKGTSAVNATTAPARATTARLTTTPLPTK
jgi:hypothetical protein